MATPAPQPSVDRAEHHPAQRRHQAGVPAPQAEQPEDEEHQLGGLRDLRHAAINARQAQQIGQGAQKFGSQYFQEPGPVPEDDRPHAGAGAEAAAARPGSAADDRAAASARRVDRQPDDRLAGRRDHEDDPAALQQQGSAAIQGYTNAYLQTLPQVQQNIGNIWGEARNLQAASSDALGQFVQGQGAALTGQMAAAEQQAGQLPTSSAVAAVGAGSGAATAAADWSTMCRG
jgi:hypothetical protein